MKKKIVIISNYDDLSNPYYSGGGAQAVHQVAKRLTKTFRVKVLTGKYPQSSNKVVDKVVYQRIGVSIGGPKLGQLIFQAVLPLYVLTQRYDLWMESFTPPFSTSFLQLYTKKPVVGLVHMLASEDMERKYKLPFHHIENIGLRTYDFFIVTSKLLGQKIESVNPKAVIKTIPNGVEAFTSLNSRRKKRYILFLGRIEVNQKGIDLLIKAFKKIADQTEYTLAIVGSGEKKQIDVLQKQIEDQKLTEKITLFGRLDGEAKKDILEQAACMVIPSRFETFSMVSLEALAAGIPLVTFNIDGLSWIPENCRIASKKFSINHLAKDLLFLESNNTFRKNLIRNGKALSKRYEWDALAKQYEKFSLQALA